MDFSLKKHLKFLSQVDYFFVVEVLGSILRCSLISVAGGNKQISVDSSLQFELSDSSAESLARTLAMAKKKFRLPVTVRTIALLDYSRSAVMSGSVSLMRSDSKSEIKQAELENLVSQGLWKVIAAHREIAATRMGISDARVRLADADVLKVRLNNHRVVNPIGFPAKTIEISYRETFVDQSVLHVLNAELTEDNLTTIVEGPAVLASLVARRNPNHDFLFIYVGATESIVYLVNQMIISRMDTFAWGASTLFGSMARQFSVDEQGVIEIINRYARHEVSPMMRRAVERSASGELAILSNGIASHQPADAALPVFVHAAMPLPDVIFNSEFSGRLGLNLMLTEVNERYIGEPSGFVVQYKKQRRDSLSSYSFGTAMAAIADCYSTSAMPLMTKTAKQRARWSQSG